MKNDTNNTLTNQDTNQNYLHIPNGLIGFRNTCTYLDANVAGANQTF